MLLSNIRSCNQEPNNMKRIIPSLVVLFFIAGSLFAQELPRSASFGAQVMNLNDSTRIALGLSSLSGTLIQKVTPGSSALKAGFSANDVLISMDGDSIHNTADFLQLLKKHHGGDKVTIRFYRKSKALSVTMTLLPKPLETSTSYDIIYSSVLSGNNQLRTIITKPKGQGTFPAVLLIGGVGCYSIDNISNTDLLSIRMWVDSLTQNGFVTMRVEKTGLGDSRGLPCQECDFNTETQGYAAGLRQLKSLPYVNKENTFIAGFSIGGIIAPLIAQQEPVKGIIVYGTAGRNWLEYELENSFRQALLGGMPADSIDGFMRAEYIRLYGLYVEKKSPRQIMEEHPQTTANFFNYPMRIEYFQQVADVNIGQLWTHTKAKVLALHGASDFVSSAAEHKLIAETVNRSSPGNGTYIEIADADHWGLFAESESISQSDQQKGLAFLPMSTSLKWLKKNM
jgi:pimeloyl-ACP methyl ester carboxylesterase